MAEERDTLPHLIEMNLLKRNAVANYFRTLRCSVEMNLTERNAVVNNSCCEPHLLQMNLIKRNAIVNYYRARPLLNMTVADQEIPDEPNNDITRQHDSLMQRIISSNCHILSHSTLLGFLSQRYTVRQISENTNSPQWKVRYFMRKLGLRSKNFSDINDANLDVIIRGLLVSFPNAGNKMIEGLYRTAGPKVSRSRLRSSYKRVRLLGDQIIPRRSLKRRCYNVRAPLSLWHIDGHHKLGRYKYVIHGCIDGSSRVITFLNVSNNNKAVTVLGYFISAVKEWGLPVRVRSDFGTENVAVCDFMLHARSAVTNPFITGRSVHNQRIERLWLDVFLRCVLPFHTAFHQWEQMGALNRSSDFDISCLHVATSRLLTATVENFKQGWNYHPLSSQNNASPVKLFESRLIRLRNLEGCCDELHQVSADMEDAENNLPPYPTSGTWEPCLTNEEYDYVNRIFDPYSVTLVNMFDSYVHVKNLLSQFRQSL